MKLYEFEAKEIAKNNGIPVPRGGIAKTPEEARIVAEKIGGEVVLKAQVLVGRRGLAGGVLFASNSLEAEKVARELFSKRVRGEKVELILVEEKICIDKEYYLSLTIDRSNREIVYLVSPLGGVEIEELVKKYPDKLLRIRVDPVIGYKPYMSRLAAKFLGLPKELWPSMHKIMNSMYNIMKNYDADLVEFNPLVKTCSNEIVAVDAKITIDDNSLYRHIEFAEKYGRELSEMEAIAKKLGFSYVELDGDIGIMCNGAGLTMATMDMVAYYGGRPANFLDIGGGASRERVREAAKLLLKHDKVKVLLVNIFGGITRCNEVARGIIEAVEETGVKKPIVIRLLGTNEEIGRRLLEEKGYSVFSEADDAVKKAVEIAKNLSR
ncbi:succinyl-CoA synthetase (ADP-forming) beta subunit [Staphylothermus marinus F1]|uniref:Succinate--CoA ligase [ADP-forming] subunit beta n=1 Tax=Staphylothermus marinus (strain ATCC 43588 / DSM 3639 / JCM 9404 / F1) TaxID=399550 RepID=SUCC_STAMF|nr:ADP-forming succinate--CoA ligase subunit beta [Staphylothermus marinus]A3DLR9.1 RecName: Full=Succinate--CoA ligase [ADP-forming] subunit beta; AltName: Full=Succinyl-CoA synthetase subunit beta; Short=SCS-beta [Staphylothermus marinus F1]ABN69579.1 succinyl-CoA synthetase (ADP-forming) beta subunit [Staphylothermus marinus F1]